LIGDKNAIMVAARILGYGKDYSFSVLGEDHTVDLSTLENKPLNEELFKDGENNFEFTSPDQFSSKLNALSEQLPPLLDDFQPAYVNYNSNPAFATYQNSFLNIRNNIINLNAELFITTNDIEKNIEIMNKELQNKNIEIDNEKKTNKKLKSQNKNADNKINGSYQMIDDYKEIYNLKYLNNFNIFFGIIFGVFICKTIFSSNNTLLKK
jgi:hypothetical protein